MSSRVLITLTCSLCPPSLRGAGSRLPCGLSSHLFLLSPPGALSLIPYIKFSLSSAGAARVFLMIHAIPRCLFPWPFMLMTVVLPRAFWHLPALPDQEAPPRPLMGVRDPSGFHHKQHCREQPWTNSHLHAQDFLQEAVLDIPGLFSDSLAIGQRLHSPPAPSAPNLGVTRDIHILCLPLGSNDSITDYCLKLSFCTQKFFYYQQGIMNSISYNLLLFPHVLASVDTYGDEN